MAGVALSDVHSPPKVRLHPPRRAEGLAMKAVPWLTSDIATSHSSIVELLIASQMPSLFAGWLEPLLLLLACITNMSCKHTSVLNIKRHCDQMSEASHFLHQG